MDLDVKPNSLLKEILYSPLYIFVYAFYGLKLITFDLFVTIYNYLSWQLDKAYRGIKNDNKHIVNLNTVHPNNNSNIDDDYYKIKGKTKKTNRKYKYNDKVMAKLELDKVELAKDLQEAGATRESAPTVYQFKVMDKNGKLIIDTMTGLSKLDINAFLLNEGYTIYSIKTSKWINFAYKESSLGGASGMKPKELIFFLTQLSTYIKSGITLSNAVNILSRQMSKDKKKSRIFQSISFELTLGENFSSSMEKQGNMFPPLLINMIKAAEASGALIETLDDMANYYTEIENTRKQMVSAITYPAIILTFSSAVIVFIMIYVVPQFTEIYASNGSEITGITLLIINFSNFITNNILYLILYLVGGILVFSFCYKKIKAFRTTVQIFLMKLPVFKDVIIYNELTIFSKTFASLLKNNVFITESMDILSKITNNEVYKAILFKTISNIVKGDKISEAFEAHWAVPDVAYYMIVTGEETGELATMMYKVSDYYQSMHKNVVNNLKTLIEPILTAGLAIVVGVIIVAVIVPMYGVYTDISAE